MPKQEVEEFFFDFETTTAKHSEVESRIYIWGCIGQKTDDMDWDLTMESFFLHLKTKNIKKGYFHNLTFDGDFMFKWLLENGFEFYKDTRTVKNQRNSWTWFADDSGSIYKMWINYEGHITTFSCSYKLLATSIKNLGKSMPGDMLKGDIDYDAYTHFDSKEEVPQELLDYLKRDIIIARDSVEKFKSLIETKMTISSTAYNDFIEYYGVRQFANDFGGVRVWNFKTKSSEPYNVLTKKDWYVASAAYAGGWTGFGYQTQGKTFENIDGYSYDINSSYPGTMMKFKMPYGGLLKHKPRGDHIKLHHVHIISAKLKDEYYNMPPFIKDKHTGKYQDSKYLTEVYDEEYSFWDVEWEDVLKFYDVEFQELGLYYFKSKMVFDDWVKKRSKHKIEAVKNKDKVAKDMWKRVINGFSGKFGQNIEKLSRIIVHDPDHIIRAKLRYGKDNEYTHMNVSEETDLVGHIAVIGYTTARSRKNLRDVMEMNRDIVLYYDTDSIYTLKKPVLPPGLIDDSEFYLWAPEYRFSKFMGIRPKVYMMDTTHKYDANGKWDEQIGIKLTASGLSQESRSRVNWDNFFDGSIIDNGKTAMVSVKGGKIILQQDFVLASTTGSTIVVDETIPDEASSIKQEWGNLEL